MATNNKEVLTALLSDLRQQIGALNNNPMIPVSVKLAVNTSFQIMDIIVSETGVNNG